MVSPPCRNHIRKNKFEADTNRNHSARDERDQGCHAHGTDLPGIRDGYDARTTKMMMMVTSVDIAVVIV